MADEKVETRTTAAASPGQPMLMPAATIPDKSSRGLAACLQRLAVAEDAEAWAQLVQPLDQSMRVYAYRLLGDHSLADDAVQEAMLTLHRHAGRFHPRPAASDPPDDQARRWVLRVLANAARMVRRAEGRARRRGREAVAGSGGLVTAVEPPDPGPDPETAAILRGELDRLPERERAAVLLHVVAELDYSQVAAELRCPLGSAKTWVHRGLSRLRTRLGRRHADIAPAVLIQLLTPAGAPASAAGGAGGHLLASGSLASSQLLPVPLGGITMSSIVLTSACAVLLATGVGAAIHLGAADPATPVVSPPGAAPAAQEADPGLQALLDKPLQVSFENTSLTDVVDFLGKLGGRPFSCDEGVGSRPVNLTGKLRMRDLIDLVAAETDTFPSFGASIHFSPPDPDHMSAALAAPLSLPAHEQGWGAALDLLRQRGLPILDAAPMEAAFWTVAEVQGSSVTQVLDALCSAHHLTWTVSAGWIILGDGTLGRSTPDQVKLMAERLAKKVDVAFSETSFADCLTTLGGFWGANIIVDHALDGRMPPITFKTREMPLLQVLNWIAKLTNCDIAVRSGCLVISHRPSPLLPSASTSGLDRMANP